MDMKYKDNPIRKLARSSEWQTIYNRSKEIGSVHLFKNKTDFTIIQIVFLRWLDIYSSLFTQLQMNEDLLDEDIICIFQI